MTKIDFFFTYEHKARELDSICLLCAELNKRNYSTKIMHLNDVVETGKKIFDAKVGVIPAAYDNKSLFFSFATSIVPQKVVNLQWEQVFSVHQAKNLESRRNISGTSKSVVHLSWGENNRNRLVDVCQIDPQKVKITGHIGMDFLRPELLSFYKDRHALLEEFSINPDKKVCVFLSSFTSTGALKHEIDQAAKTLGEQIYDRRIISIKTQEMILNWIEKYITDHADVVFVYRPHPAERDNEKINKMISEYDNFKVIRDYSVKQWIVTADQLFTWCSTSIVEAFFAGKNCQVLRPIELPNDLDMIIYQNGKFITDYKDFEKSVSDKIVEFPISEEKIHQNYSINTIPTYKIIADILEEVYHDDYYNLTEKEIKNIPYGMLDDGENRILRTFKNLIKSSFLKDIYYKFMYSEREMKYLPKVIQNKRQLYKIYKLDQQRKKATQKEIDKISNKIKSIIIN